MMHSLPLLFFFFLPYFAFVSTLEHWLVQGGGHRR